MIYTWIDIEPVRSIGWDSNSLEPESLTRHGCIHESPIGTTIHSSSYDKWRIRSIRYHYLITISVSASCILCCHDIRSIRSLTTSSRSLIRRTKLEFWTVIRISSNICHDKGLSSSYIEVSIIISSYSWWIGSIIDSSIWTSSESSIDWDHPALYWNKLTTSIDSYRCCWS